MEEQRTMYTEEEKYTLIKLCLKHKNIIEYKKIDGATNKRKMVAWGLITDEFNSMNLSPCVRQLKQLKNLYENLKKKIKKKYAAQMEVYKMGTGVGPEPHFTKMETKMIESLKDQFVSIPIHNNSIDTATMVEVKMDNYKHLEEFGFADIPFSSARSPSPSSSGVSMDKMNTSNAKINEFESDYSENILLSMNSIKREINDDNLNEDIPEKIVKLDFDYKIKELEFKHKKQMMSHEAEMARINIQIKEKELELKCEDLIQAKLKTQCLELDLRTKMMN